MKRHFTKAKSFTLLSFLCAALGIGVISLGGNARNAISTKASSSHTVTADAFRFRVWNGQGGYVYGSSATVLNYVDNLQWDNDFALTDEFNTLSNKYSLKTSVASDVWSFTSGTEQNLGFVIYYSSDTYLNFYLKWSTNTYNSFAEGVWRNHVGGSTTGAYQYSKNGGEFTTGNDFVDVWSDGAWTSSLGGSSINLRNSSYFGLDEGFDMEMVVERTSFNSRLVDKIYFVVTGLTTDKSASLTAYSPIYYMDAATNPCGNGVNATAYRKPNIGFYSYNNGTVKFSNTVFTDLAAADSAATFETIGSVDQSVTSTSITQESLAQYNGSLVTSDLATESEKVIMTADVSGNAGGIWGIDLGFAYYFDANNFVNIFFNYEEGLNYIRDVAIVACVDGSRSGTSQIARDPWDEYADMVQTPQNIADTLPYTLNFSDFGGFTTDLNMTNGFNLNNYRSEADNHLISTGFKLGFIKTRTTYKSRIVDEFQLFITARGTDNIIHNWYTAPFAFDGFTYPKGGSASSLINSRASIGFYSIGAGDVTFSNITFNGGEVTVGYTNRQLTREFVNDFMHPEVAVSDSGTGLCKTEGWYADAKAEWVNNLSDEVKALFTSDSEFTAYYQRLQAWATANGESLNDSYQFVNARISILNISSIEFWQITIVVTSILAVTTLVAFIAYKRKNKNN